jgi:hypothetical protein
MTQAYQIKVLVVENDPTRDVLGEIVTSMAQTMADSPEDHGNVSTADGRMLGLWRIEAVTP